MKDLRDEIGTEELWLSRQNSKFSEMGWTHVYGKTKDCQRKVRQSKWVAENVGKITANMGGLRKTKS